MIAATTFKDKRVALFGLARSGIATAASLQAGGAFVSAWDDNPASVSTAAAAGLTTADLRELDWNGISALVLSPGVPLTHPKPHWTVDLARRAGVAVIGDIELFARERRAGHTDAPFIAITGTNGKSTTTALLSHMLRSAGRDTQMGGNIGKAVMTLEPPAAGRHYVVECSSYQIDLAPSLDPTIGILLNLTPDHLDRHGTMQHYASVKERLVAGSRTAIIGVDDVHCVAIADRLEGAGHEVVRISKRLPVANGYFADGGLLKHARDGHVEVIVDLAGIDSLRGQHNAQNALAAVAACRTLGLTSSEIAEGLTSFPGLAHRMQLVGRKGSTLFVNDSKATNADAAAPALASYGNIYWIAGGLPKEGGIESLRAYFSRISKAYLIGEAAPSFAATLGEAVDYQIAGTLDAAVKRAADDANGSSGPEAVVLLSPACASFDQFQNFEVRGDAFVAAVHALDGVEPTGGTGR